MIIVSILLLFFSLSEYKGFYKEHTRLLKAFLPFLVIISHYFPYSFFETDISFLGYYAVSIFFFISGYGLTCKFKDEKSLSIKYISNKLLSLIIPLISSGVVYSLLVYYTEGINAWEYVVVSLQKGYFLFPISWFVCKLILLYFFFFISSKANYSLVVLFALTIICMITEKLLGIQTTFFVSDLAFGAGGVFYYLEKNELINIKVSKLAYMLTVLILLLQIKGSIYFTNLFLPIFAVPLFCCINIKENIISKFLSKVSYELYLIQTTSELIISDYISNAFLSFLLILMLSIILSYILFQIDKRVLFYLKRIFLQ